jgi:branched-chain amino acid aminotransferase
MVVHYDNRIKRRIEEFRPEGPIGFGQLKTNNMLVMKYKDGEWKNPWIVPTSDGFNLDPFATVLHYGQEIFEGAKAFKHDDGELYTFRIDENAKRFNESADIMCMPNIPVKNQIQLIETLLDLERNHYPIKKDSCFYIRPFMFGTSAALGVKPSLEYTFAVVLSPSGPYFSEGFNPSRLLITNEFKRAAPNGTGNAKAGGNYAASLRAGLRAKELGAKQVLYTDCNNELIEEAGAMNHYHVTKDGTIVIPKFTNSILQSITSKSNIELSDRLGIRVVQEDVPMKYFIDSICNGEIVEAGGLGTAAVISPVNEYVLDNGRILTVGDGNIGPVSRKMHDLLTGIQTGRYEAPEGWLRKVERRY